MHRIIKAHLDSFSSNFGYVSMSESDQFERFCAYCVILSKYSCSVDLDYIVTGVDDDGIDAISVIVDESPCQSVDSASDIFSSPARNRDVDLIFIQSKTGEKFDLGDFLKFKEGINRIVSSENYDINDHILLEHKNIFDTVISQVPKIRNGKPSIYAYYITTGLYNKPDAIERARAEFAQQLCDIGYFYEVNVIIIGRNELVKLWVGTFSSVEASLNAFSSAALPQINGIDEAYLAVVKASDFVNKLLINDEGNLRGQVFEENVRAYLGSDNVVNKSISDTIKSDIASRFPVLNNGITIVSPDVRLQGNVFYLKDYQIVNGCQTSNVLFENKEHLGDVMVNLKIVETKDENVFSDLVRATNSQSKVDENQFISLSPIIRRVEQYFNSIDVQDVERKLYLERRDRQYVGQEIPAIRIYSLHSAVKCVASMYCFRPELAFRYQKQIYSELGSVIFSGSVKESAYYSSCLAMYRFNLLVSNNYIPQNSKRYKWHILSLVKHILCGSQRVSLDSKDAEKHADIIISKLGKHSQEAIAVFEKAVAACASIENITNDRLKRQAILTEMVEKI